MLNSTKLRDYYGYKFHDHVSLGSLKETHCLNPLRYHGASIKNTYCHQPSSTVTHDSLVNYDN